MSVDKSILTEIVNSFVLKERRNRLLDFLESKKRYDDFLWELLHEPRNLDPKCIVELPVREQATEIILRKLRKLGAGDNCYIASRVYDLDGVLESLTKILPSIVDSGSDTMIYCIGNSLGYYEGHESWRYILRAA